MMTAPKLIFLFFFLAGLTAFADTADAVAVESADDAASGTEAVSEQAPRQEKVSPAISGSATFTARRNKAMTDLWLSARLPENCRLSANIEDIFRHRGLVYAEYYGNFLWKPCDFLQLGFYDTLCRTKKDHVDNPHETEWRTSNYTGAYFTLVGAVGNWKLYDRNRFEYRDYNGYGNDHWKYRNLFRITSPTLSTPLCDIAPYVSAEIYWSDNDALSGHDKWNTLINKYGVRTKITETVRLHFYYKTSHYRRSTDQGGGWRCTQHEPYFAISAVF